MGVLGCSGFRDVSLSASQVYFSRWVSGTLPIGVLPDINGSNKRFSVYLESSNIMSIEDARKHCLDLVVPRLVSGRNTDFFKVARFISRSEMSNIHFFIESLSADDKEVFNIYSQSLDYEAVLKS